MKKNDIKTGEAYWVGGSRGKAVVTGPPMRRKLPYESKARFLFPVEYPDSTDENGVPEKSQVESKDFVKPWTDQDDEHFQKTMRERVRIDEIERRLSAAGFELHTIRVSSVFGICISFAGDEAERVIERLTDG